LFPTKIWGTVTDMGKILLGLCFQYISRKSHGSVPKNFKQFWCSDEKTGSGGKLPPPTHTHRQTHAASDFVFSPMQCIALDRQ